MKQRIIAVIFAFAIFTSSFVSMPLMVYATSSTEDVEHSGGGGGREFNTWNDWTITDKLNYWKTRVWSSAISNMGLIFNPANWDYDTVMDLMAKNAEDRIQASGAADYDEWILMQLEYQEDIVTGEPQLLLSDELMDAMKAACDSYIESNTGYYLVPSYTKDQLFTEINNYKWCLEFLDLYLDDSSDVFFIGNVVPQEDTNGVMYMHGWYNYNGLCGYVLDDSIYTMTYEESGYPNAPFDTGGFATMHFEPYSFEEGRIRSDYKTMNYYYDAKYSKFENGYSRPVATELDIYNSKMYLEGQNGSGTMMNVPFTKDGHMLRVFKDEASADAFNIGEMPYYTSSAYGNYNAAGDNSCVLTESQLANSSLYGDVQNYITQGGYDNTLSDEALIAIVDMLLDANSSSGDESGNSNNNTSGGGLGSFLEGIGSLGDALLSIVGKLLEYIGKALELLTTTISDILTVIPTNITNILTALFPFIPEEWTIAIELSLVFAVIFGVVKLIRG